ncbi:sulfate respiration complex protein HmcE [Desulfoluna spongiiphila]|uniref:sulfate respiration complex protein HmcE n=1 Tax=Desulfoluna spongiiphila TaxID=419481 RepID=UPI00125C87F7|nr:hypothetical protein [Desulfoluna spongiiphila]VVS95678.1 narg-like superfamily [Desulfoluna spongiiphila]
MYQFITGPLLWLSFSVFFIGCLVHVVLYVKNLDQDLDRVSYSSNIGWGIRGAFRSLFFWMLPFGTRSWRVKPVYTVIFYLFHLCAVIAPLFLCAHAVILKLRWGIAVPTLPDAVADWMTVGVMAAALAMVIRRVVLPEVRLLTTSRELGALFIAVTPFATGYIAYHQIGDSTFWTLAHILSGEMLLVAIPFTKLSHVVLFFCSRIQIGMDFGVKRGGMKSAGMPV